MGLADTTRNLRNNTAGLMAPIFSGTYSPGVVVQAVADKIVRAPVPAGFDSRKLGDIFIKTVCRDAVAVKKITLPLATATNRVFGPAPGEKGFGCLRMLVGVPVAATCMTMGFASGCVGALVGATLGLLVGNPIEGGRAGYNEVRCAVENLAATLTLPVCAATIQIGWLIGGILKGVSAAICLIVGGTLGIAHGAINVACSLASPSDRLQRDCEQIDQVFNQVGFGLSSTNA